MQSSKDISSTQNSSSHQFSSKHISSPKLQPLSALPTLNPEIKNFPVAHSVKSRTQSSQKTVVIQKNETRYNSGKGSGELDHLKKLLREEQKLSPNITKQLLPINKYEKPMNNKQTQKSESKQHTISTIEQSSFLKAKLTQLESIKNSLNDLKDQMNKTLTDSVSKKNLMELTNEYYIENLLLDVGNLNQIEYKSHNSETKEVSRYLVHFQQNFMQLKSKYNQKASFQNSVQFNQINRSRFYQYEGLPKLILDLDNDAFFLMRKFSSTASSFPIYIPSESSGISFKFQVLLRPYLKRFLSECSRSYEVIVLSSDNEYFVKQIVSCMDPQKKYVSKFLYNNQKLDKSKIYSKDVSSMKYQMNRTLIVSNKISSYQNQLKNTVPIVPFDGNEKDRELEGLEKYLCSLARCNDLVQKNESYFKQERYVQFFKERQFTTKVIKALFKQ